MEYGMRGDILTRSDYEDILGLIQSLSEDITHENFQHKVLKALASRFDADSGTFYVTDAESTVMTPANFATINIDTQYVNRYIGSYYKFDPFFRIARKGTACRNTDIMTRQYWENLRIYREFLAPQRIYHEIDMYLHCDEKNRSAALGVISLHRPKEKPAFSVRELAKARVIAKHLAANLRQLAEYQSLMEWENLLSNITRLCPVGIIVLNRNLVPIYWNSKALDMFSCPDHQFPNTNTLTSSHPIVPAKLVENCLAINKLIQTNSADGKQCWQATLHDDEDDCMRISANVLIIPLPAEQCSHERLSPSFLVFLKQLPEAMDIMDATNLCEYRLTDREKEVVRCVCDGLSNREISEKLFIALPTVATHLRNIFEKLGVHSRGKLFGRIQSSYYS